MVSTTTTTGSKIVVGGDWSTFVIADRIGASLELIPHLFGAAQGNLPTGQRGAFFYWRTGSAVVSTATNAGLRWLEVK